jgi:predicted small secreted protein
MKKLVSAVLLVSFALSLSACNTMAGIGKDVEKAGEAVQDAAD